MRRFMPSLSPPNAYRSSCLALARTGIRNRLLRPRPPPNRRGTSRGPQWSRRQCLRPQDPRHRGLVAMDQLDAAEALVTRQLLAGFREYCQRQGLEPLDDDDGVDDLEPPEAQGLMPEKPDLSARRELLRGFPATAWLDSCPSCKDRKRSRKESLELAERVCRNREELKADEELLQRRLNSPSR